MVNVVFVCDMKQDHLHAKHKLCRYNYVQFHYPPTSPVNRIHWPQHQRPLTEILRRGVLNGPWVGPFGNTNQTLCYFKPTNDHWLLVYAHLRPPWRLNRRGKRLSILLWWLFL